MVHHNGHDLMATNDVVAPRTRRITAARITAAGLAMILVAVLGIFIGLQRQSDLSSEDVQQIRQVIADRKTQRDAEQARVQLQLDEQARVLCAVVMDFRDRAQSARARVTLARAVAQLDCARVLRVPSR